MVISRSTSWTVSSSQTVRLHEGVQEANEQIDRTMESHLISLEESGGVWNDDYDRFFDHRSEWISRELKKRIIPQDVDRKGQSANRDDFESTEIPD